MLKIVHKKICVDTIIACVERMKKYTDTLSEAQKNYKDDFNTVSSLYWSMREEFDMITKQMVDIGKIKEVPDNQDMTFDEKDNVVFLR